jgi:kynurenine formamidase
MQMINGFKIYDLTLTLSETLPCTGGLGQMPFKKTNWNWYKKIEDETGVIRNNQYGSYFSEWLVIDEHTGTHFDAPAHFIPLPGSGIPNSGPAGAIFGEDVELSKMIGSALVIDVMHLEGLEDSDCSPVISKNLIMEWEMKNGKIAPCEIVLLHTGWDKYYQRGEDGEKLYWRTPGRGWPAPDAETIIYLYEQGVKCIGTDGGSLGRTDEEELSTHVAGLSREMVYIERLTNLGELPARGFYFAFLPLKIEKSSGGPGRAIGIVPT